MADKILCPKCHKTNDIHKFCVHCGEKLFDDMQLKLIKDNPDPYCLNCGRPVKKGQLRCECGFKLADISCPDCNTKNSYTNRFCINCAKKLWTSDVFNYIYPERLFEEHLFNETLPHELRNTSLDKRLKKGIGKNLRHYISQTLANTLRDLKKENFKIETNLSEISSRCKVVSPNYCINCLEIIRHNEYSCPICGTIFSADKKRIESLQTINDYIEPHFDDVELKWTPKYSEDYFASLAPAIGESQFEYRERLKWEFA